MTEEKKMSILRDLWKQTGGKAWEPKDPSLPLFDEWIKAGYVRRCDMRCGFEAFKDAGIAWTEAGKAAMRTHVDA